MPDGKPAEAISGACPRDGATLERRSVGGVALHLCVHCHGLWIARGDLERLASVSAGTELPAAPHAVTAPPHAAGAIRCLCPARAAMTLHRQGRVWVDLCPECGALWVDGGELEQVLCARPGIARRIASGAADVALEVGGDIAFNVTVGPVLDAVLDLLADLACTIVDGVSDAL